MIPAAMRPTVRIAADRPSNPAKGNGTTESEVAMKNDAKNSRLEKREAWLVAPARAVINGGHKDSPVSSPIRAGKITGRREVSDRNLLPTPLAAQTLF